MFMYDNFDEDEGWDHDPYNQEDYEEGDMLRVDDPFDEELDEMDLAFALGFADELSSEDVNEDKEQTIKVMSLHTNPTKAGGRPFENLVQQFISDLHSGKKTIGDKL